jgi:hypothetical protein
MNSLFSTLVGGTHSGIIDPTGVAVCADGSYAISDSQRVLRVETHSQICKRGPPKPKTSVLAGAAGCAGCADGPSGMSRFNGLYGLTVLKDGVRFSLDGSSIVRSP